MRLLQIIVVLFGISFITFGLTYMSPGDPVRNMYSANGVMPTEEMVEQTREEMGLNDPFFVQYGRWLGNCLQGDFGKSYSLNKPVTELLAERLWPTLKLTLMAILLMLVLSIPLGMASALKKDTWIDYLVRGITFIGCAMPNFWVGLLLMSPGDPVRNMYSANGVMPTEEMVEQTREEMGLNDPFFVQYGRWLGNCLQGDFGKSYSLNKPVTELLAERLWPTLKLTLMAILLMLVLSIPLGMASALKKDTWIDYLVRGITFIGCAMPNFWVGLLLMMAFCVYFQIFPVISSAGDFKSLFLPALTLAIAMTSKYTRQVRTAVLDELSQDYVIGAQARGVKWSRIVWCNVFPNSLLPLITMFGLSIGSLLGGTAVVEVIFSYPGLGNLAVSAITSSDYNLIQGYVLWLALIYMVINLIVDASYVYIDPRMRLKE